MLDVDGITFASAVNCGIIAVFSTNYMKTKYYKQNESHHIAGVVCQEESAHICANIIISELSVAQWRRVKADCDLLRKRRYMQGSLTKEVMPRGE